MIRNNDYLSEFEQEFESDDYVSENEHSDYLSEFNDEEFELEDLEENEWETDDADSEYEYEEYEAEAWEHSPEQEYENRLYGVLHSGMNNEFEMDQEVDRILHEMEQDFFFGKLKRMGRKFLNSAGGQLAKKLARNSPWGVALGALSKVARGDIKGAIKGVVNNDLLRHAAGFLPGGSLISKGMDVAGALADNETPGISRAQARQAVQFAKSAYGHLANNMPRARSIEHLRGLGKAAVRKAREELRANSTKGKKKTRIPLDPGSIVTVHPTHINIWKP